MNSAYWRTRSAEASERAEHPNPHKSTWHEPSSQFSLPSATVGDALKALFGAQLDEADLLWLAGLLDCVLRFEGGSVIERYLDRTPNSSEYGLAARKLLRVLLAMDEVMTEKGEATREWQEIALALGLPSSRRQRLTEA